MRKSHLLTRLLAAFALVLGACGGLPDRAWSTSPPGPGNPTLILSTTTSTQDSGLLDTLVPDFERRTGYRVKTSAVGTGQALAIAERGDADVVLVHAPSLELDFMAKGAGERRLLVMHNDFILIGPADDPAGADAFADYLVAPDTQRLIGSFGSEKFGQPLFFPDAGKRDEDVGK